IQFGRRPWHPSARVNDTGRRPGRDGSVGKGACARYVPRRRPKLYGEGGVSELADLEYRIAKLSLAPDDVLVVKVNERVPTELFQRVANYVRSQLDDKTRKVLVIDSQVDLSVITREEIERRSV
ncbi:hypothetical protein QUT74_22530, partial [Xanthomonas citri pv. citri]